MLIRSGFSSAKSRRCHPVSRIVLCRYCKCWYQSMYPVNTGPVKLILILLTYKLMRCTSVNSEPILKSSVLNVHVPVLKEFGSVCVE